MFGRKNSPLRLLPWKTGIAFTVYSTIRGSAFRNDGTINRSLFNLINITTKVPSEPIDGLKISDITIDPKRNLWFRLYTPTNITTLLVLGLFFCYRNNFSPTTTTPLPVLFYFHGGGFAYLSPDSAPFDTLCRRLSCENSAVVVSKQSKGFPVNADVSRCFIAGDSAGGNLSHHLAVRVAKTDDDETESEIKLKNGPALSLDRTDWFWKAFLPPVSNRDHFAANVFGPNCSGDISKLKKFPPTMVVVGNWDLLQDRQRRYYQGLKRFGKEAYIVEFPNAFHGFYGLTEFPETPLFFK
ncbi:hypothetical protein MKX01_005617 [Papaver californicum]|nr:hypothetical protein MKX01_005617 [Papaver californicum]